MRTVDVETSAPTAVAHHAEGRRAATGPAEPATSKTATASRPAAAGACKASTAAKAAAASVNHPPNTAALEGAADCCRISSTRCRHSSGFIPASAELFTLPEIETDSVAAETSVPPNKTLIARRRQRHFRCPSLWVTCKF